MLKHDDQVKCRQHCNKIRKLHQAQMRKQCSQASSTASFEVIGAQCTSKGLKIR